MSKSVRETAEIFKALGDPTRLKIIKLIAATGNNLCVGIIAHKLEISQPAVSQHLKILKNAGLVEADRQGFHVHYTIVKNCLDTLGIKVDALLKTFGAEMELDNKCELKGDNKNCAQFNSIQNPVIKQQEE